MLQKKLVELTRQSATCEVSQVHSTKEGNPEALHSTQRLRSQYGIVILMYFITCASSDSTIILHWLDGSPHRFKTYISIRIANILELPPSAIWKYVPTDQNPAGCASRGLLPAQLSHQSDP